MTAIDLGVTGRRCTHWLGDQQRHCGSTNGVRAYLQGPRCKTHDPNVLTGGQP